MTLTENGITREKSKAARPKTSEDYTNVRRATQYIVAPTAA